MLIKRLLIFGPLLLLVLLLQSYFWVPTYEEQTRGNPERLREYITASSGDASLLNPILSSDSASSEIENKVFEGLLDRDRDLSLRGRLAKSWDISEVAFVYVAPASRGAESSLERARSVLQRIEQARRQANELEPEVRSSLENIRELEIEPPRSFSRRVRLKGREQPVEARVRAPARIRLHLGEVDQELFTRLWSVLGEDLSRGWQPAPRVQSQADLTQEETGRLVSKVLPATEHNPVIVFHLRPGVRFHDGHPFDAGDVKFTYEALTDPDNLSPRIADFEPIKRVEILDRLTVKMVYGQLYSPALASWSIGLLPEHLLNDEALRREATERGRDPEEFTMRDSRFNRNPVGCGPFRFVRWDSGQQIELHRFKDYWEGAPNYKRFIFRIIPDTLTQEMEFYAGTLDSYSVQPHQVERLQSDERFQSFSGTSFGYTYIGYNLRREPFDDVRVRRALSLAIDVDQIIEYVLYGQGEPITGPFVKQTDYYNDAVSPMGYDPEAALDLLREAGWERNDSGWLEKGGQKLQFTLITNTGNDIRKAVLAIVQDAWREIGVDVRTDTLEWSVFIQERVNKLDFDAIVLGWVMGIEPDLYQIWHSSQTDPYELNFVGFANDQADQLILDIRREYDHEQQVAACHRLHEIIARQQPYTFLYVGKWTAVLDKRIVIKEVDEDGEVVYKKITPTPTGDYTFYFNKWVKLPEAPEFASGR
jgi:ABC-type transport system substrate-binding protein